MNEVTVSIRELRLNFRAVKEKVEEYGSVTVTDNGVSAYVLSKKKKKTAPKAAPVDYYARLLKYQPRPLTAKESRELHDANRGDR